MTADTVRDFLKANGVNAAGGSSDAKASSGARDLRSGSKTSCPGRGAALTALRCVRGTKTSRLKRP